MRGGGDAQRAHAKTRLWSVVVVEAPPVREKVSLYCGTSDADTVFY